ncbi:MAG: GntR family transcriptional regulator [Ectothiorhodospiraceae bacterium]|nr:GntR family transcriptional regulator [Chromatiales bacterium]MCP5154806.1 GntR family transcriptional regulator [Ectothiorhodospiraceae bacterium]
MGRASKKAQHASGDTRAAWLTGLKTRLGPRSDDGPKHVRLAEALRSLIRSGAVAPHDRLPPERILADALALSVGTVQKALSTLAAEGTIVREVGRGTFVSGVRSTFIGPWHFRFVRDGSDQLLPVRATLVNRRLVRRRGPWSDAIGEDDAGYVAVARRVIVNEDYRCFSRTWYGASRFGALLEIPAAELAAENLWMTFIDRFGIPVSHAEQRSRAGALEPAVCRHLDVEPETVGLVMEVTGLAYGHQPVFHAVLSLPPGPYAMVQALQPMRWS